MTSMSRNDAVNYIEAMLERAEAPISGECRIYRVPYDVRILNEDAYTPKFVSIGPFHHGHPRLQNMERHKLVYCRKFLKRADATLESLIGYVEEAEPRVRSCYADTLHLSKEDLTRIILVDSGFIIELFWRFIFDEWSDDDTFFLKPWLTTKISLDLLLLENQLPFFVLDGLFNRAFTSHHLAFLELTFNYFAYYNRCDLRTDNVSIRHFTDLLRTFHLQRPWGRPPPMIDEAMIRLESATELLEAGVRFKVNTKSKCLLDLRFSGGVLEIPEFRVTDSTELLFRNLVAWEQCHCPFEAYVTDYVAVLDFLINTSRDVDVLVQNGILIDWLGDSDSVAGLYNSLRKNISHSIFSSHYVDLCQDLNAFCRDPIRKWRATLTREQVNTANITWQGVAFISGTLLLLLTILQSVCSVIQVVQQYKDCKKS